MEEESRKKGKVCPKQARCTSKKERILHQAEIKAKSKALYDACPEASSRDSYSANPEPKMAATRANYATNPEKRKQASQDSHSANPEVKKPASHDKPMSALRQDLDKCDSGWPNHHYTRVETRSFASYDVERQGHPLVCSNDSGCSSKLRILRADSTHFPVLRTLQRKSLQCF